MSPRSLVTLGSLLLCLAAMPAAAVVRPVFDGDADGINDDVDSCPYTPRGISVGSNGCSTPGDEDEDGIADVADACPLSPAGSIVDVQGCALDDDVDGIADGVDRCPDSRLGSLVDAMGCGPGQVAVAGLPRRSARPAAPVYQPVPPVARVPVAPATPAYSPPPLRVPQSVAPAAAYPAAPSAAPVAVPRPVYVPPQPASAPAYVAPASPAPVAPVVVAAPPVAVAVIKRLPSGLREPEETLYFEGGESDLSWSSARAVKQRAGELVKELEANAGASVVLSGHADTKSDGAQAAQLAGVRATVVRDSLAKAGVPAHRITIRVPGVAEPRFFGPELARNCRVELRVTGRAAVVVPPATAATNASVPVTSTPVAVASAPLATPVARPAPVAVPTVMPAPVNGLLGAVQFAPYSALLDDGAIASLNAFVQGSMRTLLADTATRVSVSGSIDPGETGAAAQQLAQSRAATVRAYLVSLGLPRNRIDIGADAMPSRRADVRVVSR